MGCVAGCSIKAREKRIVPYARGLRHSARRQRKLKSQGYFLITKILETSSSIKIGCKRSWGGFAGGEEPRKSVALRW
jgi:hypothetical protein